MMKAINILENKELEWSETDLPSISDNDVLIKIQSCSKLEISKNFVNQIEILHYDIFIAIVWIVNY